jgi:Glycosyl transferase family 2
VVEAYGSAAERFATGLGGLPVLVADSTLPAQALAAAARRRRSGEPFFSCVLVDDPRALVAYEYAGQLLRAQADEDGVRRLFDALAVQALTISNVAQAATRTMPPQTEKVLRDVSMMGEGLLARSWHDAERLAVLFARRRELVVTYPGVDSTVPDVPAGNGDAIVVWAAGLPVRHTAIFAYALKDFFMPVVIACANRPEFATGNVTYADPSPEVLRRAAAVIDPSIGGPASAIALARLGCALAVTTVSGAGEYVGGAVAFEPWSWRSIHNAALLALGAPRAFVRSAQPEPADVLRALHASHGSILTDGPLVSIVVPTYNRRTLLVRTLDSIAAQEYRNIEIVLVNDAGEAVDDIAARYPNVRLLVNERNIGAVPTLNTGLRAARGTYVAASADDDIYYPDIIGRLVTALERSHAGVAHANMVMRFDREAGGRRETYAYRLMWSESVDHRDSAYTPHTCASAMLVRRGVYETLGYFEEAPAADLEILLRISRHHDFIHVDQPCGEFAYESSRKNYGHSVSYEVMAKATRAIYDRYPTGSLEVEAGRQGTIDWFAKRDAAGSYWEPDMPLAEPEPRD